MPKIIITDHRHSRSLPVMINGQRSDILVGEETEVSDDIVEVLANSSIAFDVVGKGGERTAQEAEPQPSEQPKPKSGRKARLGGPKRGGPNTELGERKTSPPGGSGLAKTDELEAKAKEDGAAQKRGGDGNVERP